MIWYFFSLILLFSTSVERKDAAPGEPTIATRTTTFQQCCIDPPPPPPPPPRDGG